MLAVQSVDILCKSGGSISKLVDKVTALANDSRSRWQGKGALEELTREQIGVTIESIVDDEQVVPGAARSRRVGLVSLWVSARPADANADRPGLAQPRSQMAFPHSGRPEK